MSLAILEPLLETHTMGSQTRRLRTPSGNGVKLTVWSIVPLYFVRIRLRLWRLIWRLLGSETRPAEQKSALEYAAVKRHSKQISVLLSQRSQLLP